MISLSSTLLTLNQQAVGLLTKTVSQQSNRETFIFSNFFKLLFSAAAQQRTTDNRRDVWKSPLLWLLFLQTTVLQCEKLIERSMNAQWPKKYHKCWRDIFLSVYCYYFSRNLCYSKSG